MIHISVDFEYIRDALTDFVDIVVSKAEDAVDYVNEAASSLYDDKSFSFDIESHRF